MFATATAEALSPLDVLNSTFANFDATYAEKFTEALKTNHTTLEAYRGVSKPHLIELLSCFEFLAVPHCAPLADALLVYYNATSSASPETVASEQLKALTSTTSEMASAIKALWNEVKDLRRHKTSSSRGPTRTQNITSLRSNNHYVEGAESKLPVTASEFPTMGAWAALKMAVERIREETKEDAPDGGIQATFTTALLANALQLSIADTWHDTHKGKPTIDEGFPDFTRTLPTFAPDKYTALAILELKHVSVDVTSNDSLSQVADYLVRIMEAQGSREFAIAVIFNGKSAVELYCDKHLIVYQTSARIDDGAWLLVQALLCSSDSRLGLGHNPILVQGKKYFRTSFLGKGASCEVYTARRTDGTNTDFVLKHYEVKEDALAEEHMLKLSFLESLVFSEVKDESDNQGLIPAMIGQEGGYTVMVPKGKHFKLEEDRRFLFRHAEQLLDLLAHLHKFKWVHRDVTPSNFLLTPSRNVLLNDWSCAAQIGDKNYGGCTGMCRAPWTMAESTYSAHPADDLYSFVVSCYLTTCWYAPHSRSPRDVNNIPIVWQQCLKLVSVDGYAGDLYEKLKLQLRNLMHEE